MLPLDTDFDKVTGHPKRQPSEKEVKAFLALLPRIKKKLKAIQSKLKDFSPRSTLNEKNFDMRMRQLDEFIEKNGNMVAPTRTEPGNGLGNFLCGMRYEYKRFVQKLNCILTEDRVR